LLQLNVGESRLLRHCGIVRGEPDADIKRPVEMDLGGGAGW